MIGFVFNYSDRKVLVFVEGIKTRFDCVVGFENFLPKLDKTFLFSNDLGLTDFKLKSSLPYGRISLGEIQIVDSRDNIFWFNPKNYKEVKQILTIEENKNLENEIVVRCADLYKFFK